MAFSKETQIYSKVDLAKISYLVYKSMMSEHSLTPYTQKNLKMAQRLKCKMGHHKTPRKTQIKHSETLSQSPRNNRNRKQNN